MKEEINDCSQSLILKEKIRTPGNSILQAGKKKNNNIIFKNL
jgi:hypothetical protein